MWLFCLLMFGVGCLHTPSKNEVRVCKKFLAKDQRVYKYLISNTNKLC